MAEIKAFPSTALDPAKIRAIEVMAQKVADAINEASAAGVIDSLIVAHLEYLKTQIVIDGLYDNE